MSHVESSAEAAMNSADSPNVENLNTSGPDLASRSWLRTDDSLWATVQQILRPLASLRLTVVLLAMAVFIVFVGTLAQAQHDIETAIHQYFRCFIAKMEFAALFPKAWFPKMPKLTGYLWIPGGWSIGAAMCVNLFAAHLIRFKPQAKGMMLYAGLATMALGVAVTWGVIATGNVDGLQAVSPVMWARLWMALKVLMAATVIPAAFGIAMLPPQRSAERWLLIGVVALVAPLSLWLLLDKSITLGDSSMRILWQLMLSTIAASVLLAGCLLIFKRRGGVVVLHLGVGLMMLNELLVGLMAVESQMYIHEGETVNFVQDINTPEIAFVDSSNIEEDRHIVVPLSRLKVGKRVKDEVLPFDVELDRTLLNSAPRKVMTSDDNPATAGIGKEIFVEERPKTTGADSGGAVNMTSVYVTLYKKGTDEKVGTYLLGLFQSMQSPPAFEEIADANGKKYAVNLRFTRHYKPYSLTLNDVRFDKYLGTETARNYSSDIVLNDPSRHVKDREVRIWMNNPLRYASETFYQSNFLQDTDGEMTGLQVVKNTGWMIPYVACMIVVVGMMYHFMYALLQFLNRRSLSLAAMNSVASVMSGDPSAIVAASQLSERGNRGGKHRSPVASSMPAPARAKDFSLLEIVVPGLVVTLCATWLFTQVRPPSPKKSFDYFAFGQLPILAGGRIKPIDTLARNTLKVMSNREAYVDDKDKYQPATRWLLDVIAETEAGYKHKVFKIDSLDVQQTLGLDRQKHFLYSLQQLQEGGKIAEFERQVQEAREVPSEQLTLYQRKLLETDRRIKAFTLLTATFRVPPPPDVTREDLQAGKNGAMERVQEYVATLRDFVERAPEAFKKMQVPLIVPQELKKGEVENVWEPYSIARGRSFMEQSSPTMTQAWANVLKAYEEEKVDEFNKLTQALRADLLKHPPTQIHDRLARSDFEALFNHATPFYYGAVFYVMAFVLAALGWLFWPKPLQNASFWLIAFTLVLHTLALASRIYISGRPPVTNLYSSAVFISWGCVVIGLILERIFRLGVGNVLAGATGFAGLIIAHQLAGEGDTFTVLQAVLDTQFWLSTHVVCITLGYATTFFAGALGLTLLLTAFAGSMGAPLSESTDGLAKRAGVFALFLAGYAMVFSIVNLAKSFDISDQRAYAIHAGICVLAALFCGLCKELTPSIRRDITRMMYGTLCFATFFSFWGTVLGGLWADDSWGRFWGWDPKENGALIIVLWNALVLHARWGGMVKDRGMAVLLVFGNICTAWSWFGVNELGVGLHSYGFTEGAMQKLAVFVLSQLVVIGIGCLPLKYWTRKDSRSDVLAV